MALDLAISWLQHQMQRQQKKKIDKLDFIKIKNLRAYKATINRVKRQPKDWEKMSVTRTTQQQNNPSEKWAKDLSGLFSRKIHERLLNITSC